MEEKRITLNGITAEELLQNGADAFTAQLKKLEEEKIIAPYELLEKKENQIKALKNEVSCYKMAISLYKETLSKGIVSEDKLFEAQKRLSNTITEANILDTPTNGLKALKNDLNQLSNEHTSN